MRTPLFYSSVFILLFFIFLNCDSTNSPQPLEIDLPAFESTTVTPANITFTQAEDGYQDTTVTFNIQADLNNQGSDFSVRYTATNQINRTLISSGVMEQQAGEIYSANFDLETSTTSVVNLLIEVFVVNNGGDQSSAQIYREVIGFANVRPEMLEVNNPTEVVIPTDGSTIVVPFIAKVTDADGQDNIDQVLIEFINEDGSVLVPSPNVLLDNGQNEDVAAGDSLYTIAFTVNSSNTPNNRTAIYYAIDQAGLHSDTLSTTFNIVEGQ